jgi:hypothetical protein
MRHMTSSNVPKSPLDALVDGVLALDKPVSPGTEGIQLERHKEVQQFAEVFYRIARESDVEFAGGRGKNEITPQALVLRRFAAIHPGDDTETLWREADKTAFGSFSKITQKYLIGGSKGRPTTKNDNQRYALRTLSVRPDKNLGRKDIMSFVLSCCRAGDTEFFKRLGQKLKRLKTESFNPFNEIDYALTRYWTHPLMPLWMMTDNAGSTALSVVVDRTVQKATYKKVRKALALPRFPKHAIREVKTFKNREIEYVYAGWLKSTKKRVTTKDPK